MNLPSCPRCGLYLSARGCTAERCANPEGAGELERLRREEATPKLGEGETRAIIDAFFGGPSSDLDTFRAMLERAGVRFYLEERSDSKARKIVVIGARSDDAPEEDPDAFFDFDAHGRLTRVDVK